MDFEEKNNIPVGRFAPSPTGRMHLGNVYAALMSWLSVKSRGGRWVLRIEDLDTCRSKLEYAKLLEDDLIWLGLDWDEGGLENIGIHGPYMQSKRGEFYEEALAKLEALGLLYLCRCRRADILATQAPHQSDGRVVYSGRCRPLDRPPFPLMREGGAVRLYVPGEDIRFKDRYFGMQRVNLATHCGDFILRRADGAWAYQLAVVVDDAAMGITEVVRGCDLLLSAAQQIYLYRLLGLREPEFAHIPLICNARGIRLSKRDSSLSMDQLRKAYSPSQILGYLAGECGLCGKGAETSLEDLLELYSSFAMVGQEKIMVDSVL